MCVTARAVLAGVKECIHEMETATNIVLNLCCTKHTKHILSISCIAVWVEKCKMYSHKEFLQTTFVFGDVYSLVCRYLCCVECGLFIVDTCSGGVNSVKLCCCYSNMFVSYLCMKSCVKRRVQALRLGEFPVSRWVADCQESVLPLPPTDTSVAPLQS